MRPTKAGIVAGLVLFTFGAVAGGVGSRLVPTPERYLYNRIGTDVQRVDRVTGRTEWAGENGWWNESDRYAPIAAEEKRFGTRMVEIEAAARRGELMLVRIAGRQLTVTRHGGESFEAYADGIDDPRLGVLVARLRGYGVAVGGA